MTADFFLKVFDIHSYFMFCLSFLMSSQQKMFEKPSFQIEIDEKHIEAYLLVSDIGVVEINVVVSVTVVWSW